jgi:hypothetical protein
MRSTGTKRKDKGRKRSSQLSLAERADRYDLYQRSVQAPQSDIDFLLERFRRRRKREPLSLREDFCGSALLSAMWLDADERRTAICVDIDSEPLAWGKKNNFNRTLVTRARFEQSDVRTVTEPSVDVACAMNFSFCAFKRREELKSYFEAVRESLVADGILMCELYGGTEAIIQTEERRSFDDFTFVWEQEKYNPISNETLCHIHFEFEDGSELSRAFTYDWRLWTLPEVTEILEEAGFAETTIYWEQVDDDGDGTGEYLRTTEEENQEGWLVLVIAAK